MKHAHILAHAYGEYGEVFPHKHIEPAYLSQVAQSVCALFFVICLLYDSSSTLSPSSLIPRSLTLLFTLGFPDMISMKTCSSGHALPVLPGTLIVGDTVRSLVD